MNRKEKIEEIIDRNTEGNYLLSSTDKAQMVSELLDLFDVSKRHLLESIPEDMDGKHPEYHREVVENYLDDGC